MAPGKRQNNGRSPLVNPQRQITSFFSKSNSPSPSPTISKLNPNKSNSNPNPNPNSNSNRTPSPSPSPTTPSPLQSNPKKSRLVIGQTPSPPPSTPAAAKSYGEDVLRKRIRVYWPLDKAWYEGCVKSFDKECNKHLVQYDDGEDELLDLGKEKIEWVQESVSLLKRLRRDSFKKVVVEDDEEMENVEDEISDDRSDSSDDDWNKNVGKEDVSEDEEVDLVDEQENKVLRGRKRKSSGVKKSKSDGNAVNADFKSPIIKPVKIFGSDKLSNGFDNPVMGDVSERFSAREADKFHFLGPLQIVAATLLFLIVPSLKLFGCIIAPSTLVATTIDLRDAKRRRPGDVYYDPRTLYLPPDFLRNLSEGQKQWWEFKSKHMDKVIFFKMGKFYELFEMDAHVGAKELDLQYMKGYRVLVVEQTETPEQLELRRKEKGSKDKVVKREICAVVTKGTLTEGELLSANPDASYLMALTESNQSPASQSTDRCFGICVVDVATSRIILGQVMDDLDCSVLCCLLSELRPVEIIKPANMLSPETERAILRHTRNPLVNDLVPLSEFWDAETTVLEIKNIYNRITAESLNKADSNVANSQAEGDGLTCLPDILSELISTGDSGSQVLSALGGTLFYLKKSFLDETLLRFAKFELLPCSGFGDMAKKPYMVLDAPALENLEGVNQPFALEFRKALSRLPDMERLLARLFASSEANGRNSNKVVLYEDAAKKQLQEFISALHGCELMDQACSSLGAILENTESRQLHHILTPGKGLPAIVSILKHFKDAFDWVEANNSGRIIPHGGVDMDYDSACKKVKEIEASLTKHLKEQRKLLGDTSITYVTIGKDLYLLEVPESLRGSVPRDYELRSSKKGFFRYWTPNIKKLLGELSQAESEKESALKSILQRLIGQFCEHHNKWRQMVAATAELDALISLAIASDFYEGPTCRPVILDSCSNEEPYISAKSLGHPVLRSDSLGKGEFVPNDITIGGHGNASFILLTGPNMGGKSTLLRQVCLAVILAQVGADVPAEIFEISPVDRIFVRMGAKDHIMAGQSTFLTELSETALMLSSATRNSLVVLDELGRGTSTSDGQAIAESVLEHFVHKVQCRGLFSTHYHRLAVDYKKDPRVSLCHMACQVGNGVGGVEEVTFLYRLSPGACPKSYGVNVARLAGESIAEMQNLKHLLVTISGIPDKVLQKAVAKSTEFEAIYGKHKKESEENLPADHCVDHMVVLIQSLLNFTANLSCQKSSEGDGVTCLTELQRQAGLFFAQQN
ncbi:DNA mismatch repair protein MSH6 [Citrus sinensis]|nr:DNA mismatch repair protein MSH6 [Citrus sinensis]